MRLQSVSSSNETERGEKMCALKHRGSQFCSIRKVSILFYSEGVRLPFLLTSLVDWVFGHICYVLSCVLRGDRVRQSGDPGRGKKFDGRTN